MSGFDRKKACLILQAVLCVWVAVLLSAAAVRIYREGSARKAEHPLESVYTPENAAEALGRVSPVFFVSLGVTAAGLLLGLRDDGAARPVRDPAAERDLLLFRLSGSGEALRRERRIQRRIRLGGWTAFGLCLLPVLLYCLRREHFPEADLEAMIASLALRTFPWILAGLLILAGAALAERRSILREIDAAKAQLKAEKGVRKEAAGEPSRRPVNAARVILLLLAVLLIILGTVNGSLKDVLLKAINICTECVGLG